MPTFKRHNSVPRSQYFGRPYLPDVDLSDKTIVVTGANTCLGFECAKHLLPKGETARNAILAQTPDEKSVDIQVWPVDLEYYASVLIFCKLVREQLPRLDGFIANAGIETGDFGPAEGLETSARFDKRYPHARSTGLAS